MRCRQLSFHAQRFTFGTPTRANRANVERTRAAWKLRLLWLFRYSGGDSDRLEEVEH